MHIANKVKPGINLESVFFLSRITVPCFLILVRKRIKINDYNDIMLSSACLYDRNTDENQMTHFITQRNVILNRGRAKL